MTIPVLNLPALPANRHYRFHAMVKPTGARCNNGMPNPGNVSPTICRPTA